MDSCKAKMEEEMIKHMMLHMQIGKASVAQRSMMKGIKGVVKSWAGRSAAKDTF